MCSPQVDALQPGGRNLPDQFRLTALQKLSEGLRIQTVADALGYESAPAFVTMFRKAVGTSPRRFLALRSAPVAGGGAGL